jgi:hypothetical protein
MGECEGRGIMEMMRLLSVDALSLPLRGMLKEVA